MNLYISETKEFQQSRDLSLRHESSWLSVVGLFWLSKGISTIGNIAGSDISLDISESIQLKLDLRSDQVRIVSIRHGDSEEKFEDRIFNHDQSLTPEVLKLGNVQIELIERKNKFGIRVRDAKNPKMISYPKLAWFDIDEKYVVNARFIRHTKERTIPITIALGGEYDFQNPGKVVFEIDNKEHSLEAVRQGNTNNLFLIFKDKTNGSESYGAGRFLFVPFDFKHEAESNVLIDFNKSISPPCAYTDAATCPMPPTENYLSVRIPVGEKYNANSNNSSS